VKEYINKSNEVYDELALNDDRLAQVSCNNQRNQDLRFQEIVNQVDNFHDKNTTILDVGCGNGGFYSFILEQGFEGNYRGVDINEKIINNAKNYHKGISFECVNILEQKIKPADYVIMSGVFNTNFSQDIDYIELMMTRCFELADYKYIGNALSTYNNYSDNKLFYISPESMIKIIIKLSCRFDLIHGNPPYNYTFSIIKKIE